MDEANGIVGSLAGIALLVIAVWLIVAMLRRRDRHFAEYLAKRTAYAPPRGPEELQTTFRDIEGARLELRAALRADEPGQILTRLSAADAYLRAARSRARDLAKIKGVSHP